MATTSPTPSERTSRSLPAFRAYAAAAATVAPVALLLCGVDAGVVLARGGGARAAATVVLLSLGLWPFLSPLALVAALVRRVPALLEPRPWCSVAATAGGLLGLRVAESVSVHLFQTLRRPDLAGLLLALCAACCVAIGASMGGTAGAALDRRGARFFCAAKRGGVAFATIMALIVAWAVWRVTALDLWIHLPTAELVIGAVALGIVAAQAKLDGIERWARLRHSTVLLASFVTSVTGWAGANITYPSRQQERLVLDSGSIVAGRVARIARALIDRDGDGFSALFGGGDCDDGDAAIHPDAYELPNDGIDQDCLAGDLDSTTLGPIFPVRRDPHGQGPSFRSAVLIVLDAVRFDVTGAGTRNSSDTPELDALAAEGALFKRAWAPSPGTWPSAPSFLAGRYPRSLTWDRTTNPPALAPSNVTLAELLSAKGFNTIALVSLYMAHSLPGLTQGFRHVVTPLPIGATPEQQYDTSDSTLDAAQRLVREHGLDHTFLYVHFMDAHFPYLKRPGVEGNDDFAVYRGEVRWVDQRAGQLVRFLRAQPGGDDTLIVITADHGEAFGEHGKRFHASQLYEESVRVPLVMLGDGIAPSTHTVPVSLVDLTPTLLDVLGVPPEEGAEGDGRTLANDLAGQAPAAADARILFAELAPWESRLQTAAIEAGRLKLVHHHTERLFELYDLTEEGEQHNLVDEREADAARLAGALSARRSMQAARR